MKKRGTYIQQSQWSVLWTLQSAAIPTKTGSRHFCKHRYRSLSHWLLVQKMAKAIDVLIIKNKDDYWVNMTYPIPLKEADAN